MRLNESFLGCWRIAFGFAIGVALAGCATDNAQSTGPSAPPVAVPTNSVDPLRRDPLRVADKIHVEFHGTPEQMPYSEQEIGEDGTITLEYIGRVQAAGKTPIELEKDIEAKYEAGYYTHINITVTTPMRFFYVGGQVNASSTGGRVPYSGPITVTQAIYAAGDFNDFANKKKVELTRVGATNPIIVNCVEALRHPDKDPPVFPGDRIFVPRRFW